MADFPLIWSPLSCLPWGRGETLSPQLEEIPARHAGFVSTCVAGRFPSTSSPSKPGGEHVVFRPAGSSPRFTGVDSFSGYRWKEGSLDLSYWKLAQGLDRNGKYPHAPIQGVPWSPRQNGPPVHHIHAHPPLTHFLDCQSSTEGRNHTCGMYDT